MNEQPPTLAGPLEAEPAPRPFPWPPPPDAGLFASVDALGRTWYGSLFRPVAFFRALPAERGLGPALVYYLIIGIAAAGIALFWNTILAVTLDGEPPAPLRILGYTGNATEGLVGFLLSPPFLLLGLFVAAAAAHVFLMLLGAARAGFRTTTRTLAYAAGPQLFALVPLLGDAVGLAWSFVISVVGLREAHATETWRVLVALVVLPFVTLVLIGLLVFGLGMLLGVGTGIG